MTNAYVRHNKCLSMLVLGVEHKIKILDGTRV